VLVVWTLISAALYAAAFPPLALYPLAWLALVPLLAALRRTGVAGGAALGTLWSLGVGLGTSSWLPRMIADYFAAGIAQGWLAAAAATLATGAFYGCFGAWIAWLARRGPPPPLLVALAWGACEYARTLAPLANPWVLSGYAQAPFASFVQNADWAGVVGLGIAIAAANAVAAAALDPALRARAWRASAIGVACALAGSLVYGRARLAQEFGEPAAVRVSLVQSATPRDERFAPRHRGRHLADHVDLVTRAGDARPDLILLAELAVDAPFDAISPEAIALGRVAAQSGADVLLGAPALLPSDAELRQTNSFFVLRGRSLVDRYDKVALTPFSETHPLRGWLDAAGSAYEPGRALAPVASQVGPVGVLLCSEAMLGGAARALVREGALLLANPANDSWFANAAAARMQLDVASLRAIETRRWLVRPTLTGYTAAVDAHGRIAAVAALGVPEVLTTSVRRSRAESFYVRHGDRVAQLAAAAAALWSVGIAVRRKEQG
jgi:apolipoprotein N-acyltransferase